MENQKRGSYPDRRWKLDDDDQPTNQIVESRRRSKLITPVPRPKKRRPSRGRAEMVLGSDDHLSTAEQEYARTPIIVARSHEHRHSYPGRPRLRDAVAMRAGGRPSAAPAVLPAERQKPDKNPRSKLRGIGGRKEAGQKNAASCGEYVPIVIQRRICRYPGHPVQLRRSAGGGTPDAARDALSRPDDQGPFGPSDRVPPCRGIPGRTAGGSIDRPVWH